MFVTVFMLQNVKLRS